MDAQVAARYGGPDHNLESINNHMREKLESIEKGIARLRRLDSKLLSHGEGLGSETKQAELPAGPIGELVTSCIIANDLGNELYDVIASLERKLVPSINKPTSIDSVRSARG